MTRETRIALYLMGELVAALRANDPDDTGKYAVWRSCATDYPINISFESGVTFCIVSNDV